MSARAGPTGRAGPARHCRRLRGVDQMYLALETPVTPMHFGALVVLDGRPLLDDDGRLRLGEIRRRITDGLAGLPELRRVIHRPGPLAGAPLWIEDPTFRIERHVLRADVGSPASRCDEAALLESVEILMEPLLDRGHPLWRMWFLTGLPDGRVALLFVIHHALADGLGAMRLAWTLLTEPGSGEAPPATAPPRPTAAPIPDEAPPPWRELVLDNARGLVAAAGQLARPATWRAVGAFLRAFRAGWAATRNEPRTSLNSSVGRQRRMAMLRLDSVTAKRVARAHGGGANDVVLALAAGGVRALLASRREPIERLSPRAGIAVTLPPSERGGDAGNHFGSYAVALPIREPDPSARLRRIAAERAQAKRTQTVTGMTAVRVWTTRLPPTRFLMARQRYINVMETYLPGPPRPIDLLGARVLELIPIQPLGRNVGLTFVGSSYAGCLAVTVRADADRFADLDVLMAAMERDWRDLADADDEHRAHRATATRLHSADNVSVGTG